MHHIPPVSPVLPLPAQQHAAPAVAAPGSSKRAGESLSQQLVQVEAFSGESADEEAFRNLRWLARCNEVFAPLSQHRESFFFLPASCVSHDVPDLANEEVEIERCKAWLSSVCGEPFLRVFQQLTHDDFVYLSVHASSIQLANSASRLPHCAVEATASNAPAKHRETLRYACQARVDAAPVVLGAV